MNLWLIYRGIPSSPNVFRCSVCLERMITIDSWHDLPIGDYVYDITVSHVAFISWTNHVFGNSSTCAHIRDTFPQCLAIEFYVV